MNLSRTGVNSIEISSSGKTIMVPATQINERTVIVTGRGLKTAAVQDAEFVEGEPVDNPEVFIRQLKRSGLQTDIFTFPQHLPDVTPKYRYHLEWDSMATIPITTFQDWLEKRVEYDVRKALKKATKLGVVVKAVEFNDDLVRGIMGIYHECPIRQGKPFWHYGKDFETIKSEKSTYLDRSEFIGAYYQDELIGFIKMVYVDRVASTFHVLSMKKHSDKKPTNALIAKAVEICERKGLTHLVYGNYFYTHGNSSLTEFKRRNGFEEALVPRYYIPVTLKGWLFLKFGLHHGIKAALPPPLLRIFRTVRAKFYQYVRVGSKPKKPAESRTLEQGVTPASSGCTRESEV
jgi:hypothetical protein